ncbi:hypothetical protein BGLA2_810031 [Burkholderia gladioli]|nr:hypothetical protein BGLA2_810031 [Burkholderia gladioli]
MGCAAAAPNRAYYRKFNDLK